MKRLYLLIAMVLMTNGCSNLNSLAEVEPEQYAKLGFNPNINCRDNNYSCLDIEPGSTWTQQFPDESHRKLIMAINRTNYQLDHHSRLMIPKNSNDYNILSHAAMAPTAAYPYKHVVISINKASFAAYDNDKQLLHWGPISAGKDCNAHPENCKTRLGSFTVFRIKGKECTSSKYPLPHGGGRMPYCMFFDGGIALHGASLPGYHASQGCIRLLESDAHWLHREFIEIGTPVHVKL